MQVDNFVFPVNYFDIENESLSMNRYQASQADLALPDKQIIKNLKSIDSTIFENYNAITDSEIFDFLYHLIKNYGENLEFKSMKVMEELCSTIQYCTEHVLQKIQKINEGSNLPHLRISFKMTIFLVLFLISSTTIKKVKGGQNDILTDAMNKEKGKKKTKNQNFQLSKAVVDHQRNLIRLLKQTLNIDFIVLWERKEMDAQFFKKYIDVCIKILESSLAKDSEIISSIFYILESILNSNGSQSYSGNFQTALANLVYEGDSIDNLVQFFSRAQGPELQKLCTQALTLVVIFLVNKPNLNAESQSIKNTRDFLSKLSEKIPKVFYTNLSCFINLFKHESYYLRNAISDIMMNILRFVLVGESEQIYRESKEKFISTLLQRIYDKNSFCRCHILSILAQLTDAKVIPRKYLILFMKAGIDRLKDNSVNTRKKALQLINSVLDEICQNQSRDIDDIEKQLELAELQLKTLSEAEEKLRFQLDQLDDNSDKFDDIATEIKLVKKRIKITEENQINLLEEKEINSLVDKVISSVKMLLGSKTESDVLETIRLFMKFQKLNFKQAELALPDIRLLIFSKEKRVRDEVLTTFICLHLNYRSEEVAKELINLFSAASHQDLSALQEILETIISQSIEKGIIVIKPQTFAHLWNYFIQYERNGENLKEKRAIITILRVSFSKDTSLIKEENMESFLNILKTYIETNHPDFYILKEITKIICLEDKMISNVAKNFLIAQVYILVNSQGTSNNEWYSAAQCILTCIFKVCDSPEKLAELLIKKLHEKLQQKKCVKSLSQFIFTLSHNCLKCLIYLDSIEGKIKSITQRNMIQQENNDEQLEKVMGGMEAELEKKIEQLQLISEKILEDPFISRWVHIVEKIVLDFKTGNQLEVISVIAYCKFMCLSPSFCESKFHQILKILVSPNINSVVKSNIIIAFGDLLHRFPNIIEPFNKYLYQNLHDKDLRVRKTTLTVITHLSLNDMIKVKSDLCDVALLFQDEDPQIQSLVKQFFYQMNKKDPKTLFNLIPDALTRFSNVQNHQKESTFEIFFKNILPLLQKDKYSESLIIKLCEKLATSLQMLQIKNTAYCLSELNVNQKGLRRIIENFQSFKKTLASEEVLAYFKNLIFKLKKSTKNENKNLIEQLEEKITNLNEEVYDAEQIKKKNQQKNQKKNPKRKNQTNTAKRGKQKKNNEEDEQIEMEEESPSAQQKPPPPSSNSRRPQRTVRRRMQIIEESEEFGDGDDDYENES